jgi:TonB-dependent receptor
MRHFHATLAIMLATTAGAAQAQAQAEGDIVVTGQRASQQRAIDLKRTAIGIIDVAAADEIGRLPDRNVAEVVERLPGVGVLYDQGEGRFVSVRGIPSDLNGYTVNGFEIGNPDGQTRSLPLDVISGQLLNRVEVVKAKTANLDGQGIGGSINLVTQTAFDFDERFVVQASAQAGTQELNKKTPIRGDVSVGGRFGSNQEFGLIVGASYSDRTFTSFGFYPDDWRAVPGFARGGIPINSKFTDYSLKRERIGATGSLDWRPNDDHQIYLRGLYSRFTEDEYRQRYRLDFANGDAAALLSTRALIVNADGRTGTSTATERRQDLRLEYKEKSVLAGMFGGSSRFGDVTLDYGLARIHNEVFEPNQLWQFRGNPGIADFNFTDTLFTLTPRTELAPTGLQFRQYTEQLEIGREDIWQGRIDLKYNLSALGEGSFLAIGGKYRTTDKFFDAGVTTYTRGANAATRFTLGQFDLQGANVTAFPASGRGYLITPTIDATKIIAYTKTNLTGPLFVLDTATTRANAVLSDFTIGEDVAAVYALANLNFGALKITPGLRYENTRVAITGFRLENNITVVPATGSSRYANWLPSLIVRIAPSDRTVFRLAYTRSIGRPNYNSLSPGASSSFEDANNDGLFEGSVSFGNPALKPYLADALDATAEWYFAKGGLIAVGVFAKFIKDPIFTQSYTQTNVSFAGRNYARLGFSQPLNADKGDIVGVEIAYQQQFTFLPGLLSGFGVEANLTLTSSTLRTPGRENTTFPNQSDLIYGVQLFYQKGPVEASIAYHHTGRSLLALGANATADQFSDDFRRLDAKASFAITRNISVYAEAQNLTDEPTRQYQAGRRDWIIQNERYGRVYNFGASVKF